MKKETKILLGVGVVVALYFILKPKGLKPTPSEGDCCKMNPHPIGCTGCEGGRTPTPTNEADEYGGYGEQSSTLGEVGSRCIAAFEPAYIEGNVDIVNGKKTCIPNNWQTK